MNVQMSLYDFFAYTIPGGMHFFTLFYVLLRLRVFEITHEVEELLLSATGLILIAAASYILGLIFDFFTYKLVRKFRGEHFIEGYYADFVKQHQNLDIKFQAADWSILHAKLGLENPQVGDAVEHGNVTNHMLRNLSLGFFLFALTQAVELVLAPSILRLALILLFAFLAFFAQRQSAKFSRLFYMQIFEYTVAKDFSNLQFMEYKGVEVPQKDSK